MIEKMMFESTEVDWTNARVRHLVSCYAAGDASAADLLCDRHPPDRVAYRVVGSDLSVQNLTYGELRRESEDFAAVLAAQGIGPGDRVATLMGKSREYLVALLGIWRLGAVYVPLFTAFAPPAIAFRLRDSGARLVITDGPQSLKLDPGDAMSSDTSWSVITTGTPDHRASSFHALMATARANRAAAVSALDQIAISGGDTPIIHIFTSGTTGSPKSLEVPLRALAAFQAYAEFGLDLRAEDVYWCAADPGWAYGLYFGVLAPMAMGICSLLQEGTFSPGATMSVLASQAVTNFTAAPTVYRAIRDARIAQPGSITLRCASSAGEPLTPDVNSWARDYFGVTVHDHYGQTETGMLINNHHHPDLECPVKPGSMGQVMPGWRGTVIQEDGTDEIGCNVVGRVAMVLADSPLAWFRGYIGNPEKSAEKFPRDGQLYLTGDLGSVDEEGYFRFSSRDDDMIIMAGYRIGPLEIETVLNAHAAVSESAVIAVPDAIRGEIMEAYIVPRPGVAVTVALGKDMQEWVKGRYAAHAFPRGIHFVDALPKTPNGKIQRSRLKARRLAELACAAESDSRDR